MIAKLKYSNTLGEVAETDKFADSVPNTPENEAALLMDNALPMDTAAPSTIDDLALAPIDIRIIDNRIPEIRIIPENNYPDVIVPRPIDVGGGDGGFGGGGGGAMPKPLPAETKKKFNPLLVIIPVAAFIIYKIAK
jgi:hypothetical protein